MRAAEGGSAACWRVAGASAGVAGAGTAGAVPSLGAAVLAAFATGVDVGVVLDVALGTTLRAIGRGFGNGTFGLAEALAAITDSPTASARLAAKAVDRKAAVRAEGITALLCSGESFNRSSLRSI